MATKTPLAFLSYASQDDTHEGGKLRMFAERLGGEVRFQSGEEFPIFVDRNDVKWGQEWRSRIEQSLGATTFLIPILTPSYFKRDWCRREFFLFLKREEQLNRRDLILPVYYAICPMLEDPEKGKQDELVQVLVNRQYRDCRMLRHMDWAKPEVTRIFEQMALEIVSALERTDFLLPPVSPTESKGIDRLQEGRSPGQSGDSVAIRSAEPARSAIAAADRPPVDESARAVVAKLQTSAGRQDHASEQHRSEEGALPVTELGHHEADASVAVTAGPSLASIPELAPEPGTRPFKEIQTEAEEPSTKPVEIVPVDSSAEGHMAQGHATEVQGGDALYNLGMRHELGLGVPHDSAQARKYYIMAARKGQRDAMRSLAFLYEQGEGVIAPNSEKARVWSRLADGQNS